MTTENANSSGYLRSIDLSVDVDIDIDVDVDIEERRQIEDRKIEGLAAYTSEAALIDAMTMQLKFAYVEARHIVAVFGRGRCEGALTKTLWDVSTGGIRRPRGWFLGALKEGKEWTDEEVRLHLEWLRKKETERMEHSDNVTERRLARQEREQEAGVLSLNAVRNVGVISETTKAVGAHMEVGDGSS